MKINPLDNRYITPKTTGYASAIGIGTAIISGVSKNKTVRKFHKPSAYISAGLTVIHIALVEYLNYKWKHRN